MADEERASMDQLTAELTELRRQNAELRSALEDSREECARLRARVDEVARAGEATRENEARLRAIVESAPVTIFSKDRDSRLTYANRHMQQFFRQRKAQLEGSTNYLAQPPGVAEAHRADDLRVMETGESLFQEEVTYGADGRHIMRSVKFPLRDADGSIYGLGAIAIDVTNQ